MKSRRYGANVLVMLAGVGMLATAGCTPSREYIQTEVALLIDGTTDGDFDALVAAGDTAWQGRIAKDQVLAAIDNWEKAISTRSPGLDDEARRMAVYELYHRLSRAYYLLADGHIRFDSEDEDDVEEEMMAAYDTGIEMAESAMYVYSPEFHKAVVLDGGDREDNLSLFDIGAIPAMYWYATNLGKWALMEGLAEAIGHKDSIFAIMSRVKELDDSYYYGACYRYFGAFYTKLPFPSGDEALSRENFEKSLEMAPDNLSTRVLYGSMFGEKFMEKDFYEEHLQAVLDAKDNVIPEIEPENQIEKKKARRLLDNIDDVF